MFSYIFIMIFQTLRKCQLNRINKRQLGTGRFKGVKCWQFIVYYYNNKKI